MPNPFLIITKTIKILGVSINILSATAVAVEDPQLNTRRIGLATHET